MIGPSSTHVSHPLAISALIRTYNPSSFSLQSIQLMHGDVHVERYNERLGRLNTTALPAFEAARASPRFGSFVIGDGFAVPTGTSVWQPVRAALAPDSEAGLLVIGLILTDMLQGRGVLINARLRGFDGDAPARTAEGACPRLRARGAVVTSAIPAQVLDPATGNLPLPAPTVFSSDFPPRCDTHPATAAFFNATIAGGSAVRLAHGNAFNGLLLESIPFGRRAHIWIDIPRAIAALLNPLDPYLLEQWIRPAFSNPFNLTIEVTGMQGRIMSSNPTEPDDSRHLVGQVTQPDFAASGIPSILVPPFTESYVPPPELPLNLNVFDVPILLQFLGELSSGGTVCDVEMTVWATISGLPITFQYRQRAVRVTMDAVPPSPPAPPPPPSPPPPTPPPPHSPEPSLPPPYVYD